MLRQSKGFTLIELMVTLLLSTLLLGALYQTVVSQQQTYVVQDQVTDAQQNLRVAMELMTREIMNAGLGSADYGLPFGANGGPYNYVINPANAQNNVNRDDDQITIVGAYQQVSTLAEAAAAEATTIKLVGNASQFNPGGYNCYVCVGGVDTYIVTAISTNTLTLNDTLKNAYLAGTPVYKIKAITYRLGWDPNEATKPVLLRVDRTDGGDAQVIAENIENLQFRYTLVDGTQSDSPNRPDAIELVTITMTARTARADGRWSGDGYRRRELTSSIKIRNMDPS